ncbi:MAG: methionyl-tRNA formyltransferase [Opitutales bacterium]|nr:methionyl-tRNA formyltransferase [Opitutales bacterium]
MQTRRIVFMASDPIALPALEWSNAPDNGLELVAVFTQPDRRVGRGKKLTPNEVKIWAEAKNIQVHQPERLGAETVRWFREQSIDLCLVMAYGHFLKQDLLDAPSYGTLNLHGSILPSYRGACPVEASILDGLTETGVSLMRLVKKMDAGPVVDVEKIPIYPDDTAPILRTRMAHACPALLDRALSRVFDGTAPLDEQDHKSASFVRRLFKADGIIDFSLSAQEIERRSRAFSPWPGTVIRFGDDNIKVEGVKIGRGIDATAGTVIETDPGLGIQCGEDAIFPQKLQRPGGKMLPTKDFLNGYNLTVGMRANWVPSEPVITAQPYGYTQVRNTQ